MEEFPTLTSIEADGTGDGDAGEDAGATAADVFREGHLWTEELIDGDPLRFSVTDAGFLSFGDPEHVFGHDAVPLRYRTAVRMVREEFTRDAFVAAVENPGSVTFFGVATHTRRVPYDLDRIPPFLGTALHDADRDRYLPPDTMRRAFDRVGLQAVDPLDKELRADHVDPRSYPVPGSRYYDGPAAGVVFHNKGGASAVRRTRSRDGDRSRTNGTTGSRRVDIDGRVTDRWLDRLLTDLADDPEVGAIDVDVAVERALERLARETTALADDGGPSADVRSTLAGRIARYRRSDGSS